MKKCPSCAKDIQDDAIRCKWCNHDLQSNLHDLDIDNDKSISSNDIDQMNKVLINKGIEKAKLMMSTGASQEEIHSKLIRLGLSESATSLVVSGLFNNRARNINKARVTIIIGVLYIIAGILFYALTYKYPISVINFINSYGAILFGVILFILGLVRFLKNNPLR